MKWFQHKSDAYTDFKIQELISEFGVEAYGLFWILCEFIAQQGKSYRLNSVKFWKKNAKRWSGLEEEKINKLLDKMADLKLIDKKSLNEGNLYIPKMKKYSDDYTKRVRRTSEQDTDNVHVDNTTLHNTTLHKNINNNPKGLKKNSLGKKSTE